MFGDIDFLKAIRMEHPEVIPTTVGFLPAGILSFQIGRAHV